MKQPDKLPDIDEMWNGLAGLEIKGDLIIAADRLKRVGRYTVQGVSTSMVLMYGLGIKTLPIMQKENPSQGTDLQ